VRSPIRSARDTTHGWRPLIVSTAMAMLVIGSSAPSSPASAAVTEPSDCRNPEVPSHFHQEVVAAIKISRDLPTTWARSPYLAKVICWQDTAFDTRFIANGPEHRWHGLFAMTIEEMKSVEGPNLGNDRDGLVLNPDCFVHGWDACPRKSANARVIQQLIGGMRWIWWVYGHPHTAWRHIVRTARFNSYPRPGTDDTPTKTPLSRCPVKGLVSYQDDFGAPRTTGGFHLHSGNDVHAPIGRVVRAPFAGLAVAHSDNWFAGRSVGLVGSEGFVRNAHLSRFGHLGYVRAGTVIGYVGMTGDALTPHDHFEWHPWNVPTRLHVAPSGYSRIRDAIDPYPFLRQVCTSA
jgi:hypothetical protein